MSESAIFNSVKQLDLRSTKHATAEKIRGMMMARKTAIATISAAPSTGVVVRPSTAASTTSSGSTFRPSRSPQGNATLRRIQPEQHYASAPAPAPALPGVDAGALEAATEAATAAQAQLLALEAKCSQLEGCLGDTCQAFSNYVEATETPSSEYYTVAFPAGAIGEWFIFYYFFQSFFCPLCPSLSPSHLPSLFPFSFLFPHPPVPLPGMILSLRQPGDSAVVVAELRDDKETGAPLLAKRSGKIRVGDVLLSINDKLLARYGKPSLQFSASEFKNSPRPVRVLFRREKEGGGGGGAAL